MGNSFNEPAVAIQQNETETSYRSTSDIIRICLIAGIQRSILADPLKRPMRCPLPESPLPPKAFGVEPSESNKIPHDLAFKSATKRDSG